MKKDIFICNGRYSSKKRKHLRKKIMRSKKRPFEQIPQRKLLSYCYIYKYRKTRGLKILPEIPS
ncbi:hypothetical protein FXB85_08560 [Aggregatibacter actinomycetemcomitans]|nr:hypothetical protein FXB85_08560 [Aggregatibacter actinomycetemcomitans]